MKQKIVAIVGPTASGKTELSVRVAKHFGGEIVSADSMQIYREMNIGTAKPTVEERMGVPHHLMGHIGVSESYNVASYVEDAHRILKDLKTRSVLPVICGGTGLYIDHLLNNTFFLEIPQSDSVREKYQKMVMELGKEYVFDLLRNCDPVLADALHPNDTKRVIRGLEVFELTGRPLSVLQRESLRESPYDVLWLGLNFLDRDLLYGRIDRRVDVMVENGLLKEIDALLKTCSLSSTARAAIGYKELIDAIQSDTSIEDALALVKQKSRNYAKRQLTWFKKNDRIHWFYRDEKSGDAILADAVRLVEQFLEGDVG